MTLTQIPILQAALKYLLGDVQRAVCRDHFRRNPQNIQDETGARRVHSAFAPYGYKKDPNDKNSLIVDEEAAEVVKSIYHWFVNEGYSKMGIAKRLNQMGEPNPEAYKKKKGFKYNNPNSDKNDGLWSASTIVGYCKMKFIRA